MSSEPNNTSATNPSLPLASPTSPPWPAETSDWQTYHFHCHCGSIRYKATVSPPLTPTPLTSADETYQVCLCNCSHCSRQGYQAIHPRSKNTTFTRGLEFRAEYRYGKGENPHWFCKKCGSVVGSSLEGGNKMMGASEEDARMVLNVSSHGVWKAKMKET